MFQNKKGDMNILLILFMIMVFSIFSVMAVTVGYLYFAIGNDYIVLPTYNASQSFGASSEINAGFENTVSSYQAFDIGTLADNLWFFSYMVLFLGSVYASYKSRGMGNFSFLSMLVYGLMFVLYIAGFFAAILNLLYSDILLNLFTNLAVNVPKLEWFITNYGMVFLLHGTALLLIKVLDFDISTLISRRKKERQTLQSFDDEIV